jgi:hypothetical protein
MDDSSFLTPGLPRNSVHDRSDSGIGDMVQAPLVLLARLDLSIIASGSKIRSHRAGRDQLQPTDRAQGLPHRLGRFLRVCALHCLEFLPAAPQT